MGDWCWLALEWLFLGFDHHRHPTDCLFRQANVEASTNVDPNDPSTWGRVSRNAACPCGSGKKYKHCHGTA
ncbi:MAG: SEC-C metal-binding domain-containing protein [Rhodospirillales bacterium]